MGLIRSFLSANMAAKFTVGLLFLANIFNWIVFCMNDWGLMDTNAANDDDEQGFGVWVRCGRNEAAPDCKELDGWRLAWYGAFQAFMIFGFVSVNLAFLFIVLGVFVPQCIGNKDTFVFCFIACIVAVLTYLIAVIIFGVRFDETYDRGYDEEELYVCFDLAVVNIFLLIGSAISAFLATRTSGKSVAVGEGGSSGGPSEEEKKRKREEDKRKKEEKERKKEEEKRKKEEEKAAKEEAKK